MAMQFKSRPTWVAISLAAVLSLAACNGPQAGKSLVGTLPKDGPDSQLEFWHELNQRPMTTHNDAFHGLLLYLDGKDPSPDYAARVKALKARDILPNGFDRPADEAITRGTLAIAISRMIHLKGGVMYTLIPNGRYATRELQYAGLYPLSTRNQIFSGSEYVGIIGRLEDYQRGNAADRPASEMPADSDQAH